MQLRLINVFKQFFHNVYWIRKLKRERNLKNGYFQMVGYYNNPHVLTSTVITDCNNKRMDPLCIYRNVNACLIGNIEVPNIEV